MRALNLAAIWVCVVAVLAIGLVTRLTNPDMSETRLFLQYWQRWIAAGGFACCAVWLQRAEHRRKSS